METLRTRLSRLSGRQEARQGDGEAEAQQQRQTEDDLLLAQAPRSLHAGPPTDATADFDLDDRGLKVIVRRLPVSSVRTQRSCLRVHSSHARWTARHTRY